MRAALAVNGVEGGERAVMLTIPVYALIPALALVFGLGLELGIARASERHMRALLGAAPASRSPVAVTTAARTDDKEDPS